VLEKKTGGVIMGTRYSKEFKIAAVKRVDKTGRSVAAVAAELGINENTLHGWRKKYREDPQNAFVGSGNLKPEDLDFKRLQRENRELKEENEILKKAATYFAKNQR